VQVLIKLTHSLKPPGFKPLPLNINPGFQIVPFKFNVHRYAAVLLLQAAHSWRAAPEHGGKPPEGTKVGLNAVDPELGFNP
jgi:hypothetical protein